MRALLIVTGVIEAGAGLALLVSPSVMAFVLMGSTLDTPAGLAVGRVAGAALLALGAACWLAHHDGRSRAATGVVAAMLLYNTLVVALLASAGFCSGSRGVGLWPAAVLHTVMAVWCAACLQMRRAVLTGPDRHP